MQRPLAFLVLRVLEGIHCGAELSLQSLHVHVTARLCCMARYKRKNPRAGPAALNPIINPSGLGFRVSAFTVFG